MKTIQFKVGDHKVLLKLEGEGGTIETDFKKGADPEEEGDAYEIAIDAVESLILAHAVAGVDVQSQKYIQGLESALDAIGNNLL